ncbi:Ig-like domain-containing protein, partial [Salmonella enterica]|uniref:Ig-like domain-containing protein n=1 Tax=Salmonella enterica TaxID=28901 RepID=UPI0015928937
TATTPVTFTADASKATLTVTVTGSRQPTETDTSLTAATADGADLLTLHFKAADGNGNAVTSTPVHYTTAVSDAGIVKDTLACTTNGSGECTSTVKTTKAGTYNVWTALVPAGAAQQVSPVKTALVFLAGTPDATNTTVSTDRNAANADKKETISVTMVPRDSHGNVVPLWTFRKDLTITPSVNATVSGAVTVTAPAQDATGNVTATLTYVDTSGKLLSKEARGGTTEVAIGKSYKKSVDTRFYPLVHVCLANLSAHEFVVPGQTEVELCDGSGHAIPRGLGYTVTAPGISSSGCPANGGGVCPSDAAGVKADFTGLTGEDIGVLAQRPLNYTITDTVAVANIVSTLSEGKLAYYGELTRHYGATNLGQGSDLWHRHDASVACFSSSGGRNTYDDQEQYSYAVREVVTNGGVATGGATSKVSPYQSLYTGGIAHAIKTGGDTNPEVFVTGEYGTDVDGADHEVSGTGTSAINGADYPAGLAFVNGTRSAATSWTMAHDGTAGAHAIGLRLAAVTGWNLSDAYFVNNWPGTPYTSHKGNGDTAYPYVTQVNYVTGFICVASLH